MQATTCVCGCRWWQARFLYARVDMVRGLDGELALMELEIIEPYLYPEQGPDLGEVFVEALKEKLG